MPRVTTWADGKEHAKNSEIKWLEGYGKKHEYIMPCHQ